MDNYLKLFAIWDEENIKDLPNFVKDRKFVYCENENQKDILITGINPSFAESDTLKEYKFRLDDALNSPRIMKDNYWRPLKRILSSDDRNIFLEKKCAYTDLFYFRERNQEKLRKEILKSEKGLSFLAAQLNITQHVIEDVIKPKIILVKNKESAAYWGKLSDKGIIWMGYEFEYIRNLSFGEVFKIRGLCSSTERIAPEIKETNLKDSIIIFSKHINQYTKRDERPTANQINDLLIEYFKNKS